MADRKQPHKSDQGRQDDVELNPFPGITGEGAEATTAHGSTTEGLLGDALDGTLGDASERQREALRRDQAVGAAAQERGHPTHARAGEPSNSPFSDGESAQTPGR